jgi:hypothetical protein
MEDPTKKRKEENEDKVIYYVKQLLEKGADPSIIELFSYLSLTQALVFSENYRDYFERKYLWKNILETKFGAEWLEQREMILGTTLTENINYMWILMVDWGLKQISTERSIHFYEQIDDKGYICHVRRTVNGALSLSLCPGFLKTYGKDYERLFKDFFRTLLENRGKFFDNKEKKRMEMTTTKLMEFKIMYSLMDFFSLYMNVLNFEHKSDRSFMNVRQCIK